MKFLIIGLGSMGKRRIRNLIFNGVDKDFIFGFDLLKEKREEAENKYGIKTFSDLIAADEEIHPDVFIISTPPNLHHQYFLFAAQKKKHFFVEATTTDEGYDQLYPHLDGTFVAAPSCTFRYFPAIKKIKEIVDSNKIGKILSFTYHLGQYLPDWHPWEDYRKVYFAQKETGGCREMFVFELIWILDLVKSEIIEIKGFVNKVSDLEMSADDVYSANLLFSNKIIGNVMVDVISRTPFRTLRLIGSEGVLEWEWLSYEIKVYDAKKKEWETTPLMQGGTEKGYVTTEDMYQEEIKLFLDAISGKNIYPYSFKEDQSILKALISLENNSYANKDQQ